MDRLIELVPFLIPILVFMIPIIAILTGHQRKMAEILHSRPQVPNEEISALRREVADLRQLVHQQAIALDGRSTIAPVAPVEPSVDRLSNY